MKAKLQRVYDALKSNEKPDGDDFAKSLKDFEERIAKLEGKK